MLCFVNNFALSYISLQLIRIHIYLLLYYSDKYMICSIPFNVNCNVNGLFLFIYLHCSFLINAFICFGHCIKQDVSGIELN